MKKISLLLGVTLFVGAGCGFKQNPFDGKPDAVKDGRLPVQKVQLPPPVKSEAVRIRAADVKTFKEGEEGRLPIVVTVLEKDYESAFEISNLNDFPGAVIDSETSEFVWTPPKGFILGGVQDGDILRKDMVLRIRGTGKHSTLGNALIYTSEQSVKIVVEKTRGAPTITVSGLASASGGVKVVQENTALEFNVVVLDEDAGPNIQTQPRLEFLNPKSKMISLAPFMKIVSSTVDYKKHEFTYTISLDTGRTNLTSGYSSAGFGLRAYSRFNIPSSDFYIDTGVVAKLGDISTSWTERIEMVRGTTVRVPVLIFEDTGRAEFKYSTNGLPEDATFECATYSVRGSLLCQFVWKINEDETLAYGDFDVEITAQAGWSADANIKTKTLNFQFDIIKPTRPRPPVTNPPVGEAP
ncbi:MAG: hypothetical protein JNL11_07490 [Bdellovibrionaceae bacterium]|nr:hypothetical protein [Pseudobdellovibrionaceae bacterium]